MEYQILSIITITVFLGSLIYGFLNISFKDHILKYINCKSKIINEISANKIKIGLLTNEIPPIVGGEQHGYQFIEMFSDDSKFIIVPIFLAYNDTYTKEIEEKYPNIKIIKNNDDLKYHFKDIDICVNNLWIALETIKTIKDFYPNLPLISVCHSLIKMEHLTNLGSCYTSNYTNQK